MTQEEFSSRTVSIRGLDKSVINVAAARDLVITHVYPVVPNTAAIGLDFRDRPDEIENIVSMIANGSELINGPVDLVQGGRGVILRAPVYVGSGSSSSSGIWPWGITSLVVDYEMFLANTGILDFARDNDLLIRATDLSSSSAKILYGDSALISQDPVVLPFDFEFGTWTLYATPKGGWPTRQDTPWAAWVIITVIAVALMSFLLVTMYLSESRRKAKILLNNGINALDDGFVMFDVNDRLILCNEKYREIYDLPHKAVRRGTLFADILNLSTTFDLNYTDDDSRRRATATRLDDIRAGKSVDFVQHLANGRVIKVSDRQVQDGSYAGLRVDVSELSHAKETAEAASAAKTAFMSILSHELRTPLTVILGSARLAENVRNLRPSRAIEAALEKEVLCRDEIAACVEKSHAQTQSLMSRLIQSGDHLLHLINELLDYSKMESGSLKVNCDITDVDAIVEPVRNQLVALAEHKGLKLDVTGVAGTVYADPSRTRQILFNLVGNAIKFTESGSIHLAVSRSEADVTFEVRDTGPGIPKGECGRIFEAFYQVDSSVTRRAGGTGMGLAISRNLAVLQGGSMSVTSAPGQGSCFRLVLPARDDVTSKVLHPQLQACRSSQCDLLRA